MSWVILSCISVRQEFLRALLLDRCMYFQLITSIYFDYLRFHNHHRRHDIRHHYRLHFRNTLQPNQDIENENGCFCGKCLSTELDCVLMSLS